MPLQLGLDIDDIHPAKTSLSYLNRYAHNGSDQRALCLGELKNMNFKTRGSGVDSMSFLQTVVKSGLCVGYFRKPTQRPGRL